MPTYFIYYISLCSNSAAYTFTHPTPPSSLLTVFSFRYIKKPITYHVAFLILPLAKWGGGGYRDFFIIYTKNGVTNINPALPARHYDMQERKLIEIAKCMYNDPKLLIVDETTTALSQSGRDIIYRIMHEMADAGKAVMIISHDLNEMMEQCSTLTVLRDGVIIDNIEKENFDPDDIKQKMVGREIKGHYYRVDNDGYSDEVVLKADCITTMESLLCFDLELHKQEILGIGGLSDCGMVFSLANKNARESA